MDLSIFLAQAMGLFFLIMGFAIFLNKDRFTAIIQNTIDNPSMIFFVSIYLLIIGILLVLTHNVCDSSWHVVITLIAWLSLFKGVLNTCFPSTAIYLTEKIAFNSTKAMFACLFYLTLGIFLSYKGFVA